jgi:hypothetical protein
MRFLALALILLAPAFARAEVTRVDITSRSAVAGGQAFGTVGAYEKLAGTIAFALDPRDPRNARIVDLDRAPREADGRVHFTADLYVLRPVDSARGNGVLFFEVSNRGRKGLLSRFNAAPAADDPTSAADLGDGYLMREGYTLVWVGWEFDLGAGLLRADVPPAALQPNEAWMTTSFIVDKRATENALAREAPTYLAADPDDPEYRLTVRDLFWQSPTIVPRDKWRFKPGVSPTTIVLDTGFEPGRTYEVRYRPATPRVAGVGLAAIRDAASAFRYRTDLPIGGRHAIAFGASQTGRFLRQFLYEGFNADEKGRRVFDGVWPHIAGAARGEFNARLATPIDLGSFDTTRFPFSDLVQVRDGKRDGLLAAYNAQQVPKVFHTNTSVEYWGQGRATSLIHTTPDGKADVTLPDHSRVYLLASTQHGEAAFPPPRTGGQALNNPTPQRAVMRALLKGLRRWVTDNAAPPASRYPRLGDGSLVPAAELKFPSVPGLRDPRGAEGPAEIVDGRPRPLAFLVPQVDRDGNEIAGIRVPEVSVPLATTTGWNFRAESVGNPTTLYYLLGSYVPFAPTAAAHEARNDPRPSVAERYRDRDDYLKRIDAATGELIEGGYVLEEDRESIRERAARHWDHVTRPSSSSAAATPSGTPSRRSP